MSEQGARRMPVAAAARASFAQTTVHAHDEAARSSRGEDQRAAIEDNRKPVQQAGARRVPSVVTGSSQARRKIVSAVIEQMPRARLLSLSGRSPGNRLGSPRRPCWVVIHLQAEPRGSRQEAPKPSICIYRGL